MAKVYTVTAEQSRILHSLEDFFMGLIYVDEYEEHMIENTFFETEEEFDKAYNELESVQCYWEEGDEVRESTYKTICKLVDDYYFTYYANRR